MTSLTVEPESNRHYAVVDFTEIPMTKHLELADADLDRVVGGMDVQIGEMASTINTGGGIDGSTLGRVIGSILNSLQEQARRGGR